VTSIWADERLNTTHLALAGALLVLTVQPCGEPCGSAAEFDFLTVKVNQRQKKASFFQRLNLSQWSEAYSIPVKFIIRFRWAAAKKWKRWWNTWTIYKLVLQNEKKRIEPCCLVLCRTMHGLKTCARRQEKQGQNRASEATSLLPIWDLEILRPDSFFSLSLLEISFVLQVPKVYCS
jgi:hypothetical protein